MKSAGTRGLTLIELMVGIAVVAILIALVAPSMRELVVRQRLKSVNAEFVTDVQYARSEAVVRNLKVRLLFGGAAGNMTCYVVYLESAFGGCDCTRPPGAVCSGGPEELRTTRVAADTDLRIESIPGGSELIFEKTGLMTSSVDYVIDVSRISGSRGHLRTTVTPLGRPSVCSPDNSVNGVPACIS